MGKKPLVTTIKSNDDAIWVKMEPTLATVKILFDIFALDEGGFPYKKYSELVDSDIMIDSVRYYDKIVTGNIYPDLKCYAYMVFTHKYVHLILRRVGIWEKIRDRITESFEFMGPKQKF